MGVPHQEAIKVTIRNNNRQVDVSADTAARVDALVASGAYPDGQSVLEAALDSLDQLDDEQTWLKESVAPVMDAYLADPTRGIEADEVFARLKLTHERRMKDGV